MQIIYFIKKTFTYLFVGTYIHFSQITHIVLIIKLPVYTKSMLYKYNPFILSQINVFPGLFFYIV